MRSTSIRLARFTAAVLTSAIFGICLQSARAEGPSASHRAPVDFRTEVVAALARGMQPGCLPRLASGKRRLPSQPARVRPRARLPDIDSRVVRRDAPTSSPLPRASCFKRPPSAFLIKEGADSRKVTRHIGCCTTGSRRGVGRRTSQRC